MAELKVYYAKANCKTNKKIIDDCKIKAYSPKQAHLKLKMQYNNMENFKIYKIK